MEIRNHIYKFEVDNKEIGKYIKHLRKEKNWTAEFLAEKLCCSTKTVSSWETGVRMPSLDMLVNMSNLFGVTIHSLLLPLDNCPYDYIGAFSDASEGCIPNEYDFYEGIDEGCAQLYTREEYLLQRMVAGVFNKKDQNELYTISKFIDSNIYPSNPENIRIDKTDEYEDVLKKWISLRIEKSRNILRALDEDCPKHCGYILFKLNEIFIKLYSMNDLKKTLKAMNVIEKSILLTTCIICKKIRFSKFAEEIYNAGGLFIKGSCDNIPISIQKILEKEPDYLNKYHEKRDFYVEKESTISFDGTSWTLNDDMQNYSNIINYITYIFYTSKDKKITDIIEESSRETYMEYLKKLEREEKINA